MAETTPVGVASQQAADTVIESLLAWGFDNDTLNEAVEETIRKMRQQTRVKLAARDFASRPSW